MTEQKTIMGWFANCKTVEELNSERSILMSMINKEYMEQKKVIMSEIPPFKRIPVITMEEAAPIENLVYNAFIESKERGPAHSVTFFPDGTVEV